MSKRFSIHITFNGLKSRIDFESHSARKVVLKRFSEKYGKVSHVTEKSAEILKDAESKSVGLDGTEMDTVL
jgi:hypothetical protein